MRDDDDAPVDADTSAFLLTHSPAPSSPIVSLGSCPRSSHHWNAEVTIVSIIAAHVASSEDSDSEEIPSRPATFTVRMVGSARRHFDILSISYLCAVISLPHLAPSSSNSAIPSKPTWHTTLSMSPPSHVGKSMQR